VSYGIFFKKLTQTFRQYNKKTHAFEFIWNQIIFKRFVLPTNSVLYPQICIWKGSGAGQGRTGIS